MKKLTPRELQRLQQAAQQTQQTNYAQFPQWQQEGPADDPAPAGGNTDEPLGDSGLAALKAERKRAANLEKQLAQLQSQFQNIDPGKYQELLQAQKETQQLEEAAQKRTAQIEAEAEGRIKDAEKAASAQIATVKQHTEQVVRDALLQREYAAAGCDPSRMESFLRGWASDFRLEYDGDLPSLANAKIVPYKEGKPVYVQNDNKETVPIRASEYIAKGKDADYAIFYNVPGGGTGTYSTGKGGQQFDGPPNSAAAAWARV